MRRRRTFSRVWLAAGISLISVHCFQEPLAPVAPTWDVDLTLPLVNRTYTLGDLAGKDTSILRVGSGNELVLAAAMHTEPTAIGDLLTFAPVNAAAGFVLGRFSVVMNPMIVPVVFPDLPPGQTVPVPPSDVTLADVQHTIPTFQQITFSRGTLSLTLENNLPFPVDVTSSIVLHDAFGGTAATFVFSPPTIPANGSRTATAGVANRQLTSDVTLSGLNFHLAGSTTPVTIPPGDPLVAIMTGDNLEARRAVLSDIPSQFLGDNDTTLIPLDDSTLVREVFLKSGLISLQFTNTIGLDLMLTFRMPELQRHAGGSYIPFIDSLFLPANGSGTRMIDVRGMRIWSPDGSFVHALRAVSSITLVGSAQAVTLNDTDRINLNVSTGGTILVDSLVGVIKPLWVHIDRMMPLDFGDLGKFFSGQITIASGQLDLTPVADLGFPFDLDVQLMAHNDVTGDSVALALPASSKKGITSGSVISFDPADVGTFLTRLSAHMPDSVRIVGDVLMNPPEFYDPTPSGLGSVGRNSAFGGAVDLSVPLRLSIADGLVQDTLSLGDEDGNGTRDGNVGDDQWDAFNGGKLYCEITNGLPFQVSVDLSLQDGSRATLLTLPRTGEAISVSAPAVDAGGNVIAPAQSSILISLEGQDIRQFRPAAFLRYGVHLATTPGGPVLFRSTDDVHIRMWSTFSYQVNR